MRIGIISAMTEEIMLLCNKIEIYNTYSLGNDIKIYTGQLNGTEIVLLKSGIGKTAAAMGTTILFERYKPEIIINIGSAGGLVSILKIGDIVLPDEVRYYDVDVTIFGYKLGQYPNCPASFKLNQILISMIEKCTTKLNIKTTRGLIISGDTFVNGYDNLSKIHRNFPRAIAVEMEAAAIAQVCYNFSIPFVVIRSISDTADQKAHYDFKESLSTISKHYTCIVQGFLKELSYSKQIK